MADPAGVYIAHATDCAYLRDTRYGCTCGAWNMREPRRRPHDWDFHTPDYSECVVCGTRRPRVNASSEARLSECPGPALRVSESGWAHPADLATTIANLERRIAKLERDADTNGWASR